MSVGAGLSHVARRAGGPLHPAVGSRARVDVSRYPFLPWPRLKAAIDWQQGQHVLCVGGTGSGKSTVAGQFLGRRSHVVVCVSKGVDPIFSRPPYSAYVRYTVWPPKERDKRVLLWPANGKTVPETRANKKEVFGHAFDSILLHEGGWCIDVDELHYVCDSLGLERWVTDLEEQGRSADISLWGNTQRPSGIPLSVYVNASHAFFFQTQEEYDVKRLGSIRNKHTTPQEMMANIVQLDPHEFVYLDRTGKIPPVRSIVELGRKTA